MATTFSILFVCVGNVCRSPLAERLLRTRLDGLLDDRSGDVEVASAGVRALVGNTMDSLAEHELNRLGGEAAGFTARQVAESELARADLILTATKEIRSRVLEEAPSALRRSFTMPEFAALVQGVDAESPRALVAQAAQRRSSADVENYDIADPIGASAEVHAQVADDIARHIQPVAEAVAAAFSRGQPEVSPD